MERIEARTTLAHQLSEATCASLAAKVPDRPGFGNQMPISPKDAFTLHEPKSPYLLSAPLLEEKAARRRHPPAREAKGPTADTLNLDRTLVAGMFFQVLLEAENLPATQVERTNYIKKAVKNFLVQRLAGQITLSQFFRLIQVIEEEVSKYFQRFQTGWIQVPELHPTELQPITKPRESHPVNALALQAALARLPLPQQSNRKLSAASLEAFLRQTGGRWFRLLDFEVHFRLNKKTAWTYLALLQQHGILRHNHAKANRVRYALAEDFLNFQSAAEQPW